MYWAEVQFENRFGTIDFIGAIGKIKGIPFRLWMKG